MINAPLVELVNAVCEFPDVRPIPPLTFNVTRGEFVCLHGPTGSGKSLALRLVAGLMTPTSGKVLVAGELINDFTPRQRLWLRRTMGIMIQGGLLLEDRTVLENVMLPAIAADESFHEAKKRALAALERCGILPLAPLLPAKLSAGEKQQTCLARAVVNHPVLILADEPAANLDVDNAQKLMDLLADFSRYGVAVIVASHLELSPSSVPCRPIQLGLGDVR